MQLLNIWSEGWQKPENLDISKLMDWTLLVRKRVKHIVEDDSQMWQTQYDLVSWNFQTKVNLF